jgi:hypothetical protein
MSFEGSGGAAGMASGRSQVELIEEAGQTRVTYTVQASVGGKLGQIGGRLLDASARQLADQFFAALRAHLAPTDEVATDLAEGPLPEPSSDSTEVPSAHPFAPPPTVLAESPGSACAIPVESSPLAAEFPRLFWFATGVVSTAFSVWLGSRLFSG